MVPRVPQPLPPSPPQTRSLEAELELTRDKTHIAELEKKVAVRAVRVRVQRELLIGAGHEGVGCGCVGAWKQDAEGRS